MKLRIQGNSLRLRLTQPEVQRIARQEAVQESMQMGSGNPALRYTLTTHPEDTPLSVSYREHQITVSLPAAVAQQWAATDQISIEELLPLADDQSLHVLIEKDFQCLHRDDAEEPDQFPNPSASK